MIVRGLNEFSAESPVPFTCFECLGEFNAGSVVHVACKESLREPTRYCEGCWNKLQRKNGVDE